ncbi:olfactory receptor 8J2-like [Pseudophryne corroboree]|uniref:olfactory receptor 8J2-like n=1 Tax=Pseudophryne corroboree TaxID=495146 RepID=UPI003081EF36
MIPANLSFPNYFVIFGISDAPELQVPIFLLVLLIYLLTLGGNMTILLLVCLDQHLQTPMYFFLGNLSILDMSSSTVTLHKILTSFIIGVKKVSYVACMAQMYFLESFIGLELLILTAMSYDRYTAICNPLRYHILMRKNICAILATVCWVWAFVESIPHAIIIVHFTCYVSNKINHFFCEMMPLKTISCSDTSILESLTFSIGLFHSIFSFSLTFIPYLFIINSILKIRSSAGRQKAFYTCSSHLTVVVLLYMTLICQYLRPSQGDSLEFNKLFALFNTAAVPMLNPLIYSLKNKDVKSALKRKLNIDGNKD